LAINIRDFLTFVAGTPLFAGFQAMYDIFWMDRGAI
jgi:hypothetical protein